MVLAISQVKHDSPERERESEREREGDTWDEL